jgi:hypothetical protein
MPKVVAIVAVFLYVGLLFADHHPAWAGWKDLSPSESRIGFTGGVYGGALPFQAEENEGKDVSSELAVFGVADQFGAVVYSRLTNNKARWNSSYQKTNTKRSLVTQRQLIIIKFATRFWTCMKHSDGEVVLCFLGYGSITAWKDFSVKNLALK